MSNTHYVPRLILRKFSNELCLYNVKTGQLKENISIERAYALEDYYDSETEKNLSNKIESHFGNLLANHILKCDKVISLSRKQLYLVKKFLLISVLRSIRAEDFAQYEKGFYDRLDYGKRLIDQMYGEEREEDESSAPFEEKVVEGETPFQYWMRTLNVILDTDGTPQGILDHPDKTYPAYRWSYLIGNAYLAFWDAPNERDEFVITDIGMTSENEKGWDGVRVHNMKKTGFMRNVLVKAFNENAPTEVLQQMYSDLHAQNNFSENFMMFPISSKRMIVLISPFFKYKDKYRDYDTPPKLEDLTVIPNPRLFEPNRNYYKYKQKFGQPFKYHDDDRYIYDVKTLSSDEIRYCNALFLDRINTHLGFSSLEHAVGSIIKYKKLNDPPHVPRVDYTELYKIIQERYLGSLNV